LPDLFPETLLFHEFAEANPDQIKTWDHDEHLISGARTDKGV
jgi:hypothetical protein